MHVFLHRMGHILIHHAPHIAHWGAHKVSVIKKARDEKKHQEVLKAARERRLSQQAAESPPAPEPNNAGKTFVSIGEYLRHTRAGTPPRATTAARRRAEEWGVDLSKVKSSEGIRRLYEGKINPIPVSPKKPEDS
jgi:pyruvate/2-oxoglutarate dehydrogenase complex dihydrolipoamide acyltransferase (E2) component